LKVTTSPKAVPRFVSPKVLRGKTRERKVKGAKEAFQCSKGAARDRCSSVLKRLLANQREREKSKQENRIP